MGAPRGAPTAPDPVDDVVRTGKGRPTPKRSTAQAANMRMLHSQVLSTIEKRLGPGIVTRLDIVGPAAPSWRKGRRSIRGRGPRDTYG